MPKRSVLEWASQRKGEKIHKVWQLWWMNNWNLRGWFSRSWQNPARGKNPSWRRKTLPDFQNVDSFQPLPPPLPPSPIAQGVGSAQTRGKKMTSLDAAPRTSFQSSLPELFWGKQDRGTLSLWFISLHLPLWIGKVWDKPWCVQWKLSFWIYKEINEADFYRNMFPNTLATGQTSPQRDFIFRRDLKVCSLQYLRLKSIPVITWNCIYCKVSETGEPFDKLSPEWGSVLKEHKRKTSLVRGEWGGEHCFSHTCPSPAFKISWQKLPDWRAQFLFGFVTILGTSQRFEVSIFLFIKQRIADTISFFTQKLLPELWRHTWDSCSFTKGTHLWAEMWVRRTGGFTFKVENSSMIAVSILPPSMWNR